jgi:hypothetical protein
MKFSNWTKEKNKEFKILEQIFLDILNSTNIFENSEEEGNLDDEGPVEIPSPFSDDDSGQPMSQDKLEKINKKNKVQNRIQKMSDAEQEAKKRKKRLIADTRESMFDLRYKSMLIRASRVKKLNKINPSSPQFAQEAEPLLRKLGYNTTNLKEAFEIAKKETGNDVPSSKIGLLRSKKLKEFQDEFVTNVGNLYAIYAEKSPERFTSRSGDGPYENIAEVIENIARTLKTRFISKNNSVHSWTTPAPLVDKEGSSIIKFITRALINVEKGRYRARRKELSFGKSDDTSAGDEYRDSIRNASKPSSQTNTDLLDKVKIAFEKLQNKDHKKVIAFFVSLGLDDMARNLLVHKKVEIPSDINIGPMFKTIKSGQSNKIDLPALSTKLSTDYGIQASSANLTSWLFDIRGALLSDLSGLEESLSFSNWLSINN